MAHCRPIPHQALTLLLALAGLGAQNHLASAAEQSPWLEIHSTHFTVITDAGDKRGREVALRFEQMRAVFGQLLMKNRLNMPVPLTIIALKNERQYAQTVPGPQVAAPGFFLPGNDQNFIVLNLAEDEH